MDRVPRRLAAPIIHPSAFVASTARVFGDVVIEAEAVVMFGVVIRAETDPVVVGEETNIQDNSVLHTAPGGVEATFVHAVHSSGIYGDERMPTGGSPGGWVLDFPNGPTIYHAGDTDVFGDMSLIGELWEPNIACLPIGGHFTMGPRSAAKAARLLGVETVIPMHFGTFPILAGRPEQLDQHGGGDFEVRELAVG